MNISYTYDNVTYIDSGGTITEANSALSSLSDGDYLLGLSHLRIQFTTHGSPYNRIDVIITDGSKKATVEDIPYTWVTEYGTWERINTIDHTIDTAGLTLEADSGGTAGIEFKFYNANIWTQQVILVADTGVFQTNVCEYVTPSISSFDVFRSDSSGGTTGDDYGSYTIVCNAADMQAAKADYPALLKNAVSTVVTFTRNSTNYSNDITANTGSHVLTSGGTPLQLGGEETFTVTATLTDGINTVSMSALLSANFAIFNANAAKNSIGIGKYCDGTFTGLDVNMPAKFRKAVTFDVSPWEILWVNQNPSSSFASGDRTMSRAVAEGEMVVCFYKHLSSATIPNMQAFGWVGVVDVRLQIGIATSNNIGTRVLTFTANSNKFNASNCTYNNTTTNGTCVPIFVAALKNMDITPAMLSAWVAPT